MVGCAGVDGQLEHEERDRNREDAVAERFRRPRGSSSRAVAIRTNGREAG
jgi:hypothetical protein